MFQDRTKVTLFQPGTVPVPILVLSLSAGFPQIFLCKFVQSNEVLTLSTTLKSVFERNRLELKAKIKVTDNLLQQLVQQQLLIQPNIDDIKVSSYVTYVLMSTEPLKFLVYGTP